MSSESFLERAGCWFLHSGILEPAGGIARYYRLDLGKNAPVSTEITGYAVSTLVYLHSVTGREEFLETAKHSAAFLTRHAWNEEFSAMPFELGEGASLTYFFDCGIIIRGLLALHAATGETEWLEGAVRCGESMRSDFSTAGDLFHPILTLPDKLPLARDARWSRNPGCYQLKSAMGWFDLSFATGDPSWSHPYEQVLAYSLEEDKAFLSAEPYRERVMDRLHPYCYFLEGLLPRADRPDCRETLADGIVRTGMLLRDIAPEFVRSDVYAQLLRLRLHAHALGVMPIDHSAAQEEAVALQDFQSGGADPKQRGGFFFGRRGETMLPFSNPASTAFALQALAMWRDFQDGRPVAGPRTLI